MAKRQTRGSISLSRGLLAAIKMHAADSDVAVSAFAEFVMSHAIMQPLDTVSFDAWYAAREGRLSAGRRGRRRGRPRGGSEEAYRLRHANSEKAAAEFRRRRDERAKEKAARLAAVQARREARAERRRIEGERSLLRGESVSNYLCRHCDGPGHNKATCPELHPTPKETGSLSEKAAKHRAAHGGTLAEIAQVFGVTRQAVSQQWKRLYGDRRGERL